MAQVTGTRADTPGKVRTFLEFIKIEHALFALPFVLAGVVIGLLTIGAPISPAAFDAFAWRSFGFVLVAAVAARTLGMTLNRIVDRDIDAANPRTATRALAQGSMHLGTAWGIAVVSAAVMVAASAALNLLCLVLSPVLALVFFVYPYAKRVTWACHFVLGLAFLAAPAGGFLAVTGTFAGWTNAFAFSAAAFLWVAGFDILYALLDIKHDQATGIHSVPARFGAATARTVAAALHAAVVGTLAVAAFVLGLGAAFWVAVAVVAALLARGHVLAREGNAAAINKAFFNVNAGVGWIVLAGLWLSLG